MPVSKGPEGMKQVMREFKDHDLHSGSKTGPKVKSRAQAIAIGLNQSGMSRQSKKKSGRRRGRSSGR